MKPDEKGIQRALGTLVKYQVPVTTVAEVTLFGDIIVEATSPKEARQKVKDMSLAKRHIEVVEWYDVDEAEASEEAPIRVCGDDNDVEVLEE